SFYPSRMLADLRLTAGGYDAEYGRAQGGIVTLTSREPRSDRWRTGGAIGLLDSGVYAEGPFHDGGILMGIRRSYFDLVAEPFVDPDIPLPSYLDAQVKMSFGSPRRSGRFSPMLFMSLDHVTANSVGQNGHEEETTLTAMFVRIAAPYLVQRG